MDMLIGHFTLGKADDDHENDLCEAAGGFNARQDVIHLGGVGEGDDQFIHQALRRVGP